MIGSNFFWYKQQLFFGLKYKQQLRLCQFSLLEQKSKTDPLI